MRLPFPHVLAWIALTAAGCVDLARPASLQQAEAANSGGLGGAAGAESPAAGDPPPGRDGAADGRSSPDGALAPRDGSDARPADAAVDGPATPDAAPPPPPAEPVSVWHSWDVTLQDGSPQATVKPDVGPMTTLELYESADDDGVMKGRVPSTFSAGPHPEPFNAVERYWSFGVVPPTSDYPYVGKSLVGRGSDDGEANADAPSGVKDLQLYPPSGNKLIVAAFIVPAPGGYGVKNLGVRKRHNLGGSATLRLFGPDRKQAAQLTAMPNRAWVRVARNYDLGALKTNDRIYFAVDADADPGFDAVEISWSITRRP